MLSIGAPPTFTRNGQLLWITKSALSFSSDRAESSQGSWNVFYSSQYFSKTDQQRRFSKLLPSGSRKDQHSGAVLLTVVVSVFMFEYSCFFLLLFCVCVCVHLFCRKGQHSGAVLFNSGCKNRLRRVPKKTPRDAQHLLSDCFAVERF